MTKKTVFLIAGAMITAAVAALAARVAMTPPAAPVVAKQEAPPPPPPPVPKFLATSRPLAPGQFIDSSSLIVTTNAPEGSKHQYFVDISVQKADLIGATVRRPISAGTALPIEAVVRPGDPGFLASVLHPGMRAISVPTSAVASNAGLVGPGDRVDVILALLASGAASTTASDGSTVPPTLAAQTILHNVRVVAFNSETRNVLYPEEGTREAMTGKKDDDDKHAHSRRQRYDSVTLEVRPQDAEKLAVAKEVGTLHLALRGRADQTAGPSGSLARTDTDRAAAPASVTTLAATTNIFHSLTPARVTTYRAAQVNSVQLPSR